MSDLDHIVDQTLPIDQNFDQLKEEGLAFIQQSSGTNWTNFNAADPGVTILDQVCYALTELGYCIDFSVADILTKSNGNLPVKNQFYLPEEAFTSAPVTLEDFRKILIDASPAVGNVIVESYTTQLPGISKLYRTFVRLADDLPDNFSEADLNQQLYFVLNANRNLGDFFDVPRQLKSKQVTVYGEIEIADKNSFGNVLESLQRLSADAIFPVCTPLSHQTASLKYPEDMYDGPALKNGFIPTDILGEKQDQFSASQLSQVVQSITGIESVSELSFSENGKETTVTSKTHELLYFDWTGSIQAEHFTVICNGESLSLDDAKTANRNQAATVPLAQKQKDQVLSSGSFRDINTYYSIQNTFPVVYNIGLANQGKIKSTLEAAQANQLRGYLTLFDQVLANQFSQLANLGTIFSFKNASTAAPSDLAAFYAIQNKLNPGPTQYPAPYRSFSPTYFCQSIYDTPGVRYLLKDNQTFDFTTEKKSPQELEEESWKDYRYDPYNAYMKGLLDLTADEYTNLIQRNEVLNHLLARHGESPEYIDRVIAGSTYTGSKEMDRVIFKSLYLQNFGRLSYHSATTVDFYAADKMASKLPELDERILDQGLEGFSHDFIFGTAQADRVDAFKTSDYTDFCGLQLKTNLLFGLTPLYEDFAVSNWYHNENLKQVQQVMWLNAEQKGMLTVETGMLTMGFKATIYFQPVGTTSYYWQVDQEMNYYELSLLRNQLIAVPIDDTQTSVDMTLGDKTYTIVKHDGEPAPDNHSYLITDDTYLFSMEFDNAFNNSRVQNMLTNQELIFVLPDYIEALNSANVQKRLKNFLTDNLPVYLGYSLSPLTQTDLTGLIPKFAKWRNAMRYTKNGMPDTDKLSAATQAFTKYLSGYIAS